MLLDLLLVSASVPAFYLLICSPVVADFDSFVWVWCLSKAEVFWGCAQLFGEAVFSLSTHPTLCQTPSWVQTCHIRPCLAVPKQEAATLDSLSYYLGHRPAMPLTLCHNAYSHYKPWGSRGPPACILSVCVHTSKCKPVCGFPTGLWKHFVHLLMFRLGLYASAHAEVIFIYYLLWQQREWRGVGESVLSLLKCLTIRMKFSMQRTRGSPHLHSCWLKDRKELCIDVKKREEMEIRQSTSVSFLSRKELRWASRGDLKLQVPEWDRGPDAGLWYTKAADVTRRSSQKGINLRHGISWPVSYFFHSLPHALVISFLQKDQKVGLHGWMIWQFSNDFKELCNWNKTLLI